MIQEAIDVSKSPGLRYEIDRGRMRTDLGVELSNVVLDAVLRRRHAGRLAMLALLLCVRVGGKLCVTGMSTCEKRALRSCKD